MSKNRGKRPGGRRPRQARRRPARASRGGTPNFTVRYHPDARSERDDIREKREIVAIANVVEKLTIFGPRLPSPHQSNVEGSAESLRELRPRGGRSIWRPIYFRASAQTFVIVAVVPEAEANKAGYRRGVRRAENRKSDIE